MAKFERFLWRHRSLIESMGRPGIASWAQVSGPSLPTQQVVSFTFQWKSYAFCYLKRRSKRLWIE
jgi:lipopolysaccharide/colanic/teichoic acid biosynthesis glycosyltransferase